MQKMLGLFVGFLTLCYPLAVYFGIQYCQPWQIAAVLSLLLVLRLWTSSATKQWNQCLFLIGVLYCGWVIWDNSQVSLLLYPALINFSLFFMFTYSLFFPPTIIECLARLQHPDLPEQGIIYTTKVTKVWSVFFLLNGSVALSTALWSSFFWWSLYNGLIAYILIALVMGIEYLIRIRSMNHVR